MFTKQVTDTIMQDFFSGNLKGVLLRSTNTKLIAYFFLQLNTNNYITNNWQSVIDKNNLILATDKDEFMNRSDLSTAVGTSKEKPPIGYEIIDKYIEKLKKH